MESVIRTVNGVYLDVVKKRGSDFLTQNFSTLNQKWNLLASTSPAVGVYPYLNYITIGNGGHKLLTDGSSGYTEVFHSPKHASLYNHIPFIMRPIASDLTQAEALNYRMRVPITINGTAYFAYYARKITPVKGNPIIVNVHTYAESTAVSKYEPNSSQLNPALLSSIAIDPLGRSDYLSVNDQIPFNFSFTELTELKNAYNIIYGGVTEPIISEIGLCSGVDINQTRTGFEDYTEAYALQINYFVNVFYNIQNKITNKTLITTDIEIGGMEPMLDY